MWVANAQPAEDKGGLRTLMKVAFYKQDGGRRYCEAAKVGER